MSSVVHATAHGFVAGSRFYFGNVLPEDTGIIEGQIYWVLAAGLGANVFTFSETEGGVAVTLADSITSCIVSGAPVYTAVTDPDDVHAPPIAPSAPASCVLTSAVTVAPDGTVITRLTVTIVQPTSATLRHTVVTVTGGSNAEKVVIPVGQTTGSIVSVVPGVTYTGSAIAYDIFGLASAATASAGHVAAGDVTAPGVPVGLAATAGILAARLTWTANSETDLAAYDVAESVDGGGSFPTTRRVYSNILVINGLLSTIAYVWKIRAVDNTGNASAYSSTVTATPRKVTGTGTGGSDIAAGSISATDILADTITANEISAGAITASELAAGSVTAAKLNIQDAYGATVLDANGFGGSWLDFLASGLIYNSAYKSGDTSDIAVTEVGTSSTLADYLAGAIQAHLPFWVVSASGGVLKNVTDVDYKIGQALESSSSGVQTNRWFQDIPLTGLDLEWLLQWEQKLVYIPTGQTVTVNVYASFRNADHSLRSDSARTAQSSTAYTAATYEQAVTGVAATNLCTATSHGFVAGSQVVFTVLNGGGGLAVGTTYYVIASGLTANDFKISTTLGGSEFDFVTNITAGSKIMAAQFDNQTAQIVPSGDTYGSFVRVEFEVVHSGSGSKVRIGQSVMHPDIVVEYVSAIHNVTAAVVTANVIQAATALEMSTGAVDFGNVAAMPTLRPTDLGAGAITANDRCFRTDYGMEFFYDGTRWLSSQVFASSSGIEANTAAYALSFAATAARVLMANMVPPAGTDVYITTIAMGAHVASGGTALGASHSWVLTFNKGTPLTPATSVGSITINSGSSGVWRPVSVAINALLGLANSVISMDLTKTGTPGVFEIISPFTVYWRMVAT